MPVYTEGRHAAEFILSEANGHRSRANGTLVTGQNLAAGTVVMDNGAGKLTAWTAAADSDEALETEAAGILIYPTDATATDVAVAYIARDAEVNLKTLTYPAETSDGGEEAHVIASLERLGIIAYSPDN